MRGDTIFALATAPGRAGIAVIRLSGPQAWEAAARLVAASEPRPRHARRAILRDPTSGETIDDGIVIFFPGPASFTGEDVVELQVHGGGAILTALFDALARMPGLRPAAPGEFTRRAFEAGKLDLAQAEAIADLIDAESPAALAQARRQADGALSALYEGWRAECLALMAMLAADIDFADEAIDDGLALNVRAAAVALAAALAGELAQAGQAERIRSGLTIALIGPPNAGKSSILNCLANRPAAIVSDMPGTTRDVVEVRLRLGRHQAVLADTAGLRADPADSVEAEGIRRTRAAIRAADLVVLTLVAGETAPAELPGDLILWNKADLRPDWRPPVDPAGRPGFLVSAKNGDGIAAVLAALTDRAATILAESEHPALTNARHVGSVQAAETALRRAAGHLPARVELAAEDLRAAADALGRIAGRVDVEEILGAVFARFCIGK